MLWVAFPLDQRKKEFVCSQCFQKHVLTAFESQDYYFPFRLKKQTNKSMNWRKQNKQKEPNEYTSETAYNYNVSLSDI